MIKHFQIFVFLVLGKEGSTKLNDFLPASYQSLPFPEPNENGYFRVFLSSFDTPSRVWLQPITQQSLELEALNAELKKVYGCLDLEEGQLSEGLII